MVYQLIFLLAFSFFSLSFYTEKPDKIETNQGFLEIQPISHATLVLMWNDVSIYVDPTGGAKAFSDLPKPNIVLLTVIHGDH